MRDTVKGEIMKFDDYLRPYRRRLVLEALINALFAAAAGGFGLALFLILLFRLIGKNVIWGLVIGLSLGVTAVVLVAVYLTVYRFSRRALIRRIDEAGLQDRVSAMRELWKDDSYIARCQREDTIKRLKAVKPRAIRLKLPFIAALVLLPTAFLSIGAAALPSRTTRVEPWGTIDDDYTFVDAEFVQKMDELYQSVDSSTADDHVKDKIHDILDNMQEILTPPADPEDAPDEMEQASDLEDLLEQLDELKRQSVVSASIGAILVKFPETKPLGEALISRKDEDVDSALDTTLDMILNAEDQGEELRILSVISEKIDDAIIATEAWEGNELVKALRNFTSGLDSVAELTEKGENPTELLKVTFSTAKEEIKAALAIEKENEKLIDQIKQELQDQMQGILNDNMTSDKNVTEDEESGPMTPENSYPSGGQGQQDPSQEAKDDMQFYDPLTGEMVQMDEANLAAYRQRLEEAIAAGDYSEEEINYFYHYYDLIKKQLEKNNGN